MLRNVSTTLCANGLTLLIGDNGAGKSTLLRALSGLKRTTVGKVNFLDRDKRAKKAKVSFSADASMLYAALSVQENLKLFVSLTSGATLIDQEIERWQVSKLFKKRVSQLSRGEQARVQLALAFAQKCDFILLDEPTNALDSSARAALVSALSSIATTCGAVIATHEPDFFKQFNPRVLQLVNGSIAEGGS